MILPRTGSLFSKTSFIIAWLVGTLSSFALKKAAEAPQQANFLIRLRSSERIRETFFSDAVLT